MAEVGAFIIYLNREKTLWYSEFQLRKKGWTDKADYSWYFFYRYPEEE